MSKPQKAKKISETSLGIITAIASLITAIVGCVALLGIPVIANRILPQTTNTALSLPTSTLPVPINTQVPSTMLVQVTPSYEDLLDISMVGTETDFSLPTPFQTPDPNSSSTSNDYLHASPYHGIFLSTLSLNRLVAPSWEVHFSNGDTLPGESNVCLYNAGAPKNLPGIFTGPLNIRPSHVVLDIAIMTDYRYSYQINGFDVIVSDYTPQEADISYLEVGLPGAGGFAGPMKAVQTTRIWAEGKKSISYHSNLSNFLLKPNNGVHVFIPITMIDGGDYKFIVKFEGIASPTVSGEAGGEVSLTSSQENYAWVKIKDPRDYKVEAFDRFSNQIPVDLIPCP